MWHVFVGAVPDGQQKQSYSMILKKISLTVPLATHSLSFYLNPTESGAAPWWGNNTGRQIWDSSWAGLLHKAPPLPLNAKAVDLGPIEALVWPSLAVIESLSTFKPTHARTYPIP